MEWRKTLKSGAYPRLEKALEVFFDNQRSLAKPIFGTLLQERLEILHEKLDTQIAIKTKEPKEQSHGFIEKFKQRYGIRSLKCVGEKASANKSAVEPFIHDFLEMIARENLTRDQIYNADETALCWRAIPTRTLAGPCESKVEVSKADKERLTLVACSNASGSHKLDLAFIYTFENPRALKHIKKDKLPVKYYSQSKAWRMTANIFDKWFSQEFVPAVKNHLKLLGLEEKAILVLDNAPGIIKLSLVPSEHSNIHCVFFPPNTTSLIQPMDQGVLDTLKGHYRRKLMRRALDEKNEHKYMAEVKKTMSVKDAIEWSSMAWGDITPYSLSSSWNMITFHRESPGG